MKMKKLLIIGLTVLAVGAAGTAVVAASGNETPADIIASLTGRSQEEVQAEKQERDLTYGAMAAEAGELEAFRSESRRHVRQQGTGER